MLDANVFFADVPIFTQSMELGGEEVTIFIYLFIFALTLTKMNI